MVLCLGAPISMYTLTGVNIYDQNSIYSMSLFQFRICCATVLWHLLIYLVVLNKIRLKLSIFNNKPIFWASTIIIKGGFEGLGDPELDELHETSKPLRTATQQEIKNKDSSGSNPWLNLEVNAVPVPPEGSNAKPTEKSTTSGYPFWPRKAPAFKIPILPGSDSEPALTSEAEDKKKVRIHEYTEVTEISELGLDKSREKRYELIKLEPKNKLLRDNSDPSNSNTLNYFKENKQKSEHWDWHTNFKWERAYPKKDEENWPEIEVVNQKWEEFKRYKSAGSLAGPNLYNINGHINNPSSTSSKDARIHLQELKKKFK